MCARVCVVCVLCVCCTSIVIMYNSILLKGHVQLCLCVCFILHYSVVLLLYYSIALYEMLTFLQGISTDLSPTNTILIDD